MKKSDYIILLLLACILVYHHKSSNTEPVIIPPQPDIIVPVTPIVPPDEPKPVIKTEYEQALDKASKNNKILLAIFTADWCGHCRSLKKDLPSIIDTSKYEVYIINTDDESAEKLTDRFDIKMIPCSIMIDPKLDKELKKICGYIPDKYKTWLKE